MPPLSDAPGSGWAEQPGGDPADAPPDRRELLKLLAASFALGGVAGCTPAQPDQTYVPAVVAPPGVISGVPNFYATASVADGTALGIVVEHNMGRPIKVEGNPGHPSSLGSTDAVAQALILDFYNPDRAVGLQHQGRPSPRQSLLTALLTQRGRIAETKGRGFAVLTGPVSSATVAASIEGLSRLYPEMRWYVWDPFAPEAARMGAMLAYGRPVEVVPQLDKADVILALDSDLFDTTQPGHVRFAREFAKRRNPVRANMNRVYAVEASPTLIGAASDQRFAAAPETIRAVVAGLAAEFLGGAKPSSVPDWFGPVLADLKSKHGKAFIAAGPELPPQAHAVVHAVNEALGGRGQVYDLLPSPLFPAGPLAQLQSEMEAGRVEQLLVLDSNPAFTAPDFVAAMRRVPFIVTAGVTLNETGLASSWFVPLAHPFESWGDARGHDGTATVLQPQSLPLHGAWSTLEILAGFAGPSPVDTRALVQQTWREQLPSEEAWRAALASGVVPGTASGKLDVKLRPEAARQPVEVGAARPVQILFRPDPYLLDGRFANNPWLQELPRPHTKLVWDNPLLVSPELAAGLGVSNGDVVAAVAGEQRTEIPVWIVPGQAANVAVAVPGNGRRVIGVVGAGAGFDLFPLRTAVQAAGDVVELKKVGRSMALASTDRHYRLEADTTRILRRRTLEQFKDGDYGRTPDNPKPDELLYRRRPKAEVQWGMSIDLNACIGCNACVVACMAENNVPVVGKESVLKHREMHWIRIDRYDISKGEISEGGPVHPAFQPVLCMHCEQAPCEYVCPVEATQHDSEGLNLMIYNRCVGTRFCSNNCPYKVRRFNYANWVHLEMRPPIARNPDVTARTRGVMEKCTFCVQRIAQARIAHDRDGVKEQAITACAAACPTEAFAFGNLNDKESEVAERKRSPIDYPLLPETSTYPRVTYETRILNRNKEAKA